ncbi:MAG: hypothetical protein K6B72_00385 [Lachnospiraceae bacterium]|nr:hypothetical protein [Lachnospiraceae bacterium]
MYLHKNIQIGIDIVHPAFCFCREPDPLKVTVLAPSRLPLFPQKKPDPAKRIAVAPSHLPFLPQKEPDPVKTTILAPSRLIVWAKMRKKLKYARDFRAQKNYLGENEEKVEIRPRFQSAEEKSGRK